MKFARIVISMGALGGLFMASTAHAKPPRHTTLQHSSGWYLLHNQKSAPPVHSVHSAHTATWERQHKKLAAEKKAAASQTAPVNKTKPK